MYEYTFRCLKILDGDTLHADIDLGARVHYHEKRLRLLGLNAPEIHAKDPMQRLMALRAKERVSELLLPDRDYIIRTELDRTEKFGGLLGRILLPDGTVLNDLLLSEGLAVPYDGGKR